MVELPGMYPNRSSEKKDIAIAVTKEEAFLLEFHFGSVPWSY